MQTLNIENNCIVKVEMNIKNLEKGNNYIKEKPMNEAQTSKEEVKHNMEV